MNLLTSKLALGIVEDRHDPLQLGRVRVRVFGIHSPDRKNDIQIEDLPWSIVMQPTNASTGAAGISQLTEGTWVVVMYLDENLQDPMIIGSVPNAAPEGEVNYELGFTDPFGQNPRWKSVSNSPRENLSATSLIAKEDEWTEHPTYDTRRERRQTQIPIAKKYAVDTVLPDTETEDTETWNERDLRGADNIDAAGYLSQYPYNNVTEYEGGLVEEYDSSPDTADGEPRARITEMHPSGSYREVVGDGSTTFKIVGDGYSIVLKDHHMYVSGDLNMTVEGDMRHLVKGDYVLEVRGDYQQKVEGNRIAKIDGSDATEILNTSAINISESHSLRCGENQTIQIDGTSTTVVRESENKTILEDSSIVVGNNAFIGVANDLNIATSNDRLDTIGNAYSIEGVADITIDSDSIVRVNP
jgi:hypothetical protein